MAIPRNPKDPDSGDKASAGWYLEGFADEGRTWTIAIKPLPFTIGRRESCHLRLSSSQVSRLHAEIYQREDALWLREFGSTNGTFLNRQRLIDDAALREGDILHFGPFEFRVARERPATPVPRIAEDELTQIAATDLPKGFVECEFEFGEMLRQHAVIPYFQPIVRLSDREIVGYELLGRSDFEGVPNNAGSLLLIARKLGKEIELSELFRRAGVSKACAQCPDRHLFFNTVPAEMKLRRLEFSLRELRLQAPSLPLAMEIHETAVTDLLAMKKIRELLDELDIALVYDDFGAGQARLVELIEVPPDYLKFDISLIRNIHRQSRSAQKVLQTLVHMAGDLDVKTLAEGIEREQELEVCTQLGFDLAQGYYFGRPEPDFRHLRGEAADSP